MKNWNHILLAALAALSLQACEVRVNTGATKVHAPQSSLPEDAQLNAPVTTAAAAPPPVEPAAPVEAVPPVEPAAPVPLETTAAPEATAAAPETAAAAPETAPPAPVADVSTALPAQPDASVLGAPAAAADAAEPAAAGIAAPTELSLFIEANAPGAKTAAGRKTDKRAKKS